MLNKTTILERQGELAGLINAGALTAPVFEVLGVSVSYGDLISLIAAVVGAEAIAAVLPERLKKFLGTTNKEVIESLSAELDSLKDKVIKKVFPRAGAVVKD